jgi:integrase
MGDTMTVRTDTASRLLSGPAVLRPKQIRVLLNAPDRRTRLGKRDAALLAVLVGGGLRLGEACGLNIEGVELTERVRITIRTAKSRGMKFRTVTLPGPAARLLVGWLAYAKPRFWVFPGNHGESLTARHAGRIVRTYLRKIGRGDLHPHSLRHGVGAMIHERQARYSALNRSWATLPRPRQHGSMRAGRSRTRTRPLMR